MVTIKDIAKKAGVSHGTVSNVLNNKGNVSVKKIKLVNQACKDLGYISNESAKLLRKGETNTISIILPNTRETQYCQFVNGIRSAINSLNFRLQIFDTLNRPEKEKEILFSLAMEQNNKIISLSSLSNTELYEEILPEKTPVTFVVKKPEGTNSFFGFDSGQAIEDLKNELKHIKKNQIAVFMSDLRYPFENNIVRALTSSNIIEEDNVFAYSTSILQKEIFSLITSGKYSCFLAVDPSSGIIIREALIFLKKDDIRHVAVSGDATQSGTSCYSNYFLNYFELGIQVAVNTLIKATSKSEVLVECAGFLQKRHTFNQPAENIELSLLSVPNPTVKAICRLKNNFENRSFSKLQITEIATIGFEQKLMYATSQYDLIRIDVAQFPMESRRSFLPLVGLSKDLDKTIQRLTANGFEKFMNVEGHIYGLPLDPSSQLLFYRKDLFNDPIIKRIYFENFKSELKIPSSWIEYVQIASFFSNLNIDNSNVNAGLSMNTENVFIIATDFFSAYYSLGGKLQFKGNITYLDERLAKQAVSLYTALRKDALIETDPWWTKVISNYVNGKTAMLIGYMNHLSSISSESIISNTGYASVPGKRPLLGGGVIGINKESKNIESATNFLIWLFEQQTSREITRQGGTTSSIQINKLEEFSQTYPWLYKTNTSLCNGIRENITGNSTPVNLKIIEHIIGTILKERWSDNSKDIVKIINQSLSDINVTL